MDNETPPIKSYNLRLRPQTLRTDGEGGGSRCKSVSVRAQNETTAMTNFERFLYRLKNFSKRVCCCQKPEGPGIPGTPANDKSDRTVPVAKKKYFRRRGGKNFLWCGQTSSSDESHGLNPQKRIAMQLHWMFRVNFFVLLCLSCIVFFTLILVFAVFIILAGYMDPECVRIGGQEFGANGTRLADAFVLSWTTFSTVGYGNSNPALSNENNSPSGCLFITAICSLESFVGVLYSGFCGAILFGKVLRLQSRAQVLFSDPVVIRFGSGLEEANIAGKSVVLHDAGVPPKVMCPVLEFRLVNRLFAEVGGEIIDATLNCVADIDADDAEPDAIDSETVRRNEYLVSATNQPHSVYNRGEESNFSLNSNRLSPFHYFSGGRRNSRETAKIVSKRIFCKLELEAPDHPFFKRIWVARHVLDDSSPILTNKIRKAIRRNGGFWPELCNNHLAIRRNLQFNQILISLNGVSNVSASDVYAQKMYDFVDVRVGYKFVNLLYRDRTDGKLKIDSDLINDVRDQDGGGGEELQ